MTGTSTASSGVYVLDTVALIRHLEIPGKLGSRAKGLFAAGERGEAQLLVPPIVVAELFNYFRKSAQRTRFRDVYELMKGQPQFQFLALEVEDVREFMELDAVSEMHDRIIAGHARQLGVPLVTNDSNIQESGYVTTIW